jgi:hypothetical protein
MNKQSGSVRLKTYTEYARAATGLPFAVVLLLLLGAGQGLIIAVSLWLAHWSRATNQVH